jgi:uncharacterized protein involved in exopolysaccharide biosynthesis
MEQLDNTFNLGETIDKLKLLLKFYLNNYKIILVSIFISLAFSSIYYIWEKPKFQADTTFVLMESGGSKGGSLASLTSQFGIDLGGLGGQSSIFSGDNIFDIFKSKTVVEKVLLTKYDSTKKTTLMDVYLQNLYKRRFLKFAEIKIPVNYYNYTLESTPDRLKDSLLDVVYGLVINSNIKIDKLNKKGSIIKLTVDSKDEKFSKLLNERLIDEVKSLYFKIKNSNTQENINKLQRKADSLEYILNNKSIQTANAQVINVNPALRKAAVPSELKQKDLTIVMAIYGEVIKNLEFSRMTQAQQTPIFQVLDRPKFPLFNSKLQLRSLIFLGFIIGFFISTIICLIKFFYK